MFDHVITPGLNTSIPLVHWRYALGMDEFNPDLYHLKVESPMRKEERIRRMCCLALGRLKHKAPGSRSMGASIPERHPGVCHLPEYGLSSHRHASWMRIFRIARAHG